MGGRQFWVLLWTWLVMGGALAQTPPSPPPQEELFLEVILNGEQPA
jgi:outer membrane usher protein